MTKNATYPGVIGPMINPILPAALAVRQEPGNFVDNAAKESARRTAAQLPALSSVIVGSLRGETEDRCGDLRAANRRRDPSRLIVGSLLPAAHGFFVCARPPP